MHVQASVIYSQSNIYSIDENQFTLSTYFEGFLPIRVHISNSLERSNASNHNSDIPPNHPLNIKAYIHTQSLLFK